MLSTSKVLAGGLAAATTAILGSYFGVFGTVGGAAAGSVATALSTELYQRSIDRTTDHLRSRTGQGPREQRRHTSTPQAPRGSSLPRLLLGAVVIFALGIAAVSGIERVTGAPLSGGTEGTTSLGRVLHLDPVPVLGGLLGTSPQTSDTPGEEQEPQRSPGLVGGLLSGL